MSNKRVSAIIIESGKILLMHRIKPDNDYFVLPGGSVEKNEVNVRVLVREVKEETSLEIEVEKCFVKLTMNLTNALNIFT